MHFTLDVNENVATLGFQEGFLDDREIRALRESVRALVTEGNTKLVIDLAEATHVNSTLIGAMVEIYTSYNKPARHPASASGRSSVLAGLSSATSLSSTGAASRWPAGRRSDLP